MSDKLSLKKNASEYTPATELGDLTQYVERTFVCNRNGQVTAVKLAEVKNRNVRLEYPGGRADSFSLPQEKFRKLYQLAPAA
ncbi:hypothetical protein AVT69_gp223 [Pseudomonas phage PhiPA3]|uniref:Uncharacterized protein 225 n=1 Tax=Pseudomonas phage PhiPA3 TaxID=998086 RepID=F8SJ68_BPPA3|nr:hypothetical protein AVT69_gp223 [Pseudomonas phage PhiPA3]AEH03648.1 hypothetical protein [Pseudomonas phage PhiPA3]